MTPEKLKAWWEGYKDDRDGLPPRIADKITEKINALADSPKIDPVTGVVIPDDRPSFLAGHRERHGRPDA